ncbi:MAG TPA: farnesyl diphosphate synthase [Thermoanaerobaculia bacterium]|nr:farnesyl diphosphate synthase [Thermoanaerobaculia bacterium]
MAEFVEFLADLRPEVERALDRLLPAESARPARLHAAMRYSVFAGGKRVRPALVVLGGEIYGAPRETLLPAAAAMEMIHTFSLVHDDLPALDDDDLRRGRPTVHKQFDEALAILAGDALLNHALLCLAREPASAPPAVRARAVAVAGESVGSTGMIGGQVADLEAEQRWPDDPAGALEWIHRRKTGCLLEASLVLGGIYAEVSEPEERRLRRLGAALGLLFQIGDDLLDVLGSTEELGKTAGKDAAARKLTYPGLYGVDESRRRLRGVAAEALELACELPRRQDTLRSLIHYLGERDR